MRGLFSIDSPLMRFLSKLADLMILNILFLVTSVPLVTIGASLTALNYVTFRMVMGTEGQVARDYFRSFRQNFRQATAIWVVLLLFAFVLQYDVRLTWGVAGTMNAVVLGVGLVGCVALVMELLYVFPVLAKFDNTVRGTMKNALGLALRHPGRTISMFMPPFALGLLTFYTVTTMRWGILAWVAIGFSGVAYCNAFPMKKTFEELVGPMTAAVVEDEDEAGDE